MYPGQDLTNMAVVSDLCKIIERQSQEISSLRAPGGAAHAAPAAPAQPPPQSAPPYQFPGGPPEAMASSAPAPSSEPGQPAQEGAPFNQSDAFSPGGKRPRGDDDQTHFLLTHVIWADNIWLFKIDRANLTTMAGEAAAALS